RAYSQAGGYEPLDQVDPILLGPIGVLFLVNLVLGKSIRVLFLYAGGTLKSWPEIRSVLPELLLAELFPLPLALLLAVEFDRLSLVAFLLSLGGALVFAALFRETQRSRMALNRHVLELNTINRIGQMLAARLSFDDLLQTFYSQVAQIANVPVFHLATYDKEADELSFPLVIEHGERVERGPGKNAYTISEHIIKTSKPLLLSGDVPEQLRSLGIQSVGLDVACFLGVPLIAENQVIGLFSLQHPTDATAYTAADLHIMTTLASQVAVAVRNASLYRHLSESVEELARLNNVSSITSTLDLDVVLDTTAKVVTTLGKADKVAVFLLDEQNETLHVAFSSGLSDDFVAQLQHLSRRVFQPTEGHPETLVIPDVHADPRTLGWRTLAEMEGYTGMLIAPLINASAVIGFLMAFYEASHTFSRSEVYLITTLANQVAVTVANARLYRDSQVRAREMTQLAEAARDFAASLDLGSVTQMVLERLDSLLKPQLITLLIVQQDGQTRSIAALGEPVPEALSHSASVAQVLTTGEALSLPISTEDVDFLRSLGLGGLFAVPFVHQGKPFGVALIGHQSNRRYDAHEQQLAEALINQAAIAIRNAQLYAQTDEALDARITELSAIEEISRKISASFDLEEIINEVLNVTEKISKADYATCALVSDAEQMTLIARHSEKGTHYPRLSVPIGEGIIGRVIRTGQPVRLGDTRPDPDYVPPHGVRYLSELCVPIEHNNERVGVINVESHRPGAFTESHEKFITNVAEHAAIAIENARLLEARQRQIDILIEFRNLSLELLTATSMSQVMNLIVEYTLLIAGSRDVSLYLYDRTADQLTFGTSLWTDGRENVEVAPLTPGGIPWQVIRTGKLQTVSDMTAASIASVYRKPVEIGALVCIAIKRASGHILGILNIGYQKAHYFTSDELRALELLANQAAIALEDIRLFDEVRQRRDQMQVILDSTRDGMVLVDASSAVVLANPAADRLLGYPLRQSVGRNLLRQISSARRDLPGAYQALVGQLHQVIGEIRNAPDQATRRVFQLHETDIEETTLPVLDSTGHPAGRLIVLRDISEEKSLERFRNEVTDMMVHDLRSPLSNVISCLRYMQEMAAIKEFDDFDLVIATALSSSDDQMRMIESVLEIARLESRRVPL
ncbi:MAG TPA: GAF domain-containing protein, partial [Aggregatilineales bacterium]|nr:GAF domain-containing protein [Aggregatilineales bacterium]